MNPILTNAILAALLIGAALAAAIYRHRAAAFRAMHKVEVSTRRLIQAELRDAVELAEARACSIASLTATVDGYQRENAGLAQACAVHAGTINRQTAVIAVLRRAIGEDRFRKELDRAAVVKA